MLIKSIFCIQFLLLCFPHFQICNGLAAHSTMLTRFRKHWKTLFHIVCKNFPTYAEHTHPATSINRGNPTQNWTKILFNIRWDGKRLAHTTHPEKAWNFSKNVKIVKVIFTFFRALGKMANKHNDAVTRKKLSFLNSAYSGKKDERNIYS